MGLFKTTNQFSAENAEKPTYKVVLGVITGSFWIVSALLLFLDAFFGDLSKITNGITGNQLSSPLIIDYVSTKLTFLPIYNQVIFVENIITFCISLMGIITIILIGLALRKNSTSKIWDFIFVAGIIEIFVFSLANTIIKSMFIGFSSSILVFISALLSLIAGVMYFTILPINDIKAGMILIASPLAYLGGAIAIVLLLLLIVSVLYSLILGRPIFPT